jgi:predicted extracellular nuclease
MRAAGEQETEMLVGSRRKLGPWLVASLIAAVLAVVGAGPSHAATGDPVLINEVLASHTGTDDTEYIELFGTPGQSLAGLSLIVVEGDAFDPGRVDRRFDFRPFHAIGPNGFFLVGNCAGLGANYGTTPDTSIFTNYLENSSLTVALVETASAPSVGDQVSGSEVVRDSVALDDGDAGDTFYFGAPVIGPDGPFFPAGARRVADGIDTDVAADWVVAAFSLGAANTPTGGGFDGCAPIPLTIPEIQGDGQFSDYQGEVVITAGVVTAISAAGFDGFIQDPTGDGDAATSDGIFVDDFQRLSGVAVGDLITIQGAVEEQQFGNALPLTRINNPILLSIDSNGNPLPAAVQLTDQPDTSIADTIDLLERLEGMRVEVSNAFVVAPTNGFGEFVLLTNEDAKNGSGYEPGLKQMLLRSTGPNEVDYNPERIMVDDLTLDDAIVVQAGDKVKTVVGPLDYAFGNYKIQPTDHDIVALPLPSASPLSVRNGPAGDTAITTFNVENLFDLVDDPIKDDIGTGGADTPEELETQLAKLALAVEIELQLPEIMVLQEVENTGIAQELGDRVNAATGTDYVATSFETSDGRGIEVAFVWDANRVSLLEAFQLSGPDVEAAFGPTSPSPGREPLYGRFEIGGEVVHIVGNHFKSKGGDDPIFGIASSQGLPFERVTEVQRRAQAQVVRDFVDDAILDADPGAKVMVTGDLNDFEFGEPGEVPDHPVGILEGSGGDHPLTNLVNLMRQDQRWTYVFDGNSQVLDHMLVNDALLDDFESVNILHFNAPVPAPLEGDGSTALRASDHDPIEGRFDLGA